MKNFILILLFLIAGGLSFLASNAFSNNSVNRIWYVATTGNDSAAGTINNPLRTIQRGINSSVNGDTVIVLPGTYFENVVWEQSKQLAVGSLYLITGDTAHISQTIIDGQWNGNYGMTIGNYGYDTGKVFTGFTITNSYPGGLLIKTPIYVHHVHTENNIGSGIDIFPSGGSRVILHDIISNYNTLDGIHHHLANVKLDRIITSNNGRSGIWLQSGVDTILNVLATNNEMAIYCYASTLNIHNCTFVNNIYGIYYREGGNVLINNTILNNTFKNVIQINGISVTRADYNLIKNGQYSFEITPPNILVYGLNNISSEPIFVNPQLQNYSLSDFSPGIGGGSSSSLVPYDIILNPRPNPAGSNPDIGAYENPRASKIPVMAGDANADTSVNVLDVTTIVNYILGNLPPVFYFESADVNHDTLINVLDVVGVINIIMNPGYDAIAGNNENDNSNSGSLGMQNNFLMLSSTVPVSALQFRISGNNAPGVTFQPNPVLNQFQVVGGNQGDTSRTYIIYSMNSSLIPGGAHNLGTFSGLSSGMTLRDVIIADSLGSNIVTETGNEMTTEFPKEYSLSQNYPNPFNPRTTISFQIPKAGMTKLSVYDITGRLMKTLVNEYRNAGYYEEVFDAGQYASGVYIYRLEAGNYISSRKMIIIK